jgi:glutaminyl-peptide cyclotransferase
VATGRLIALSALGGLLLALASTAFYLWHVYPAGWSGAPPPLTDARSAQVAEAAWDGERAMRDIAAQLRHAPRSPGTPGQAATIAYIEREIGRTGRFALHRQAFGWTRDDGVRVPLVNLVARLAPEKTNRILLGTHHDSLVRAYRDPVNPYAPMPGASNSASGVAVLLETARALAAAPNMPDVGVDLVFFDGEEGPNALGGGEKRWKPLGSSHFVARLGDFYSEAPEAVVILDLVCREGLRLRPEPSSLKTGRAEVARLWRIGEAVAPQVFEPRAMRFGVGDDHTPFWQAGIPAALLIDIRPTPWFNTTLDNIDKCRPPSLSAVGRTLVRYLYSRR